MLKKSGLIEFEEQLKTFILGNEKAEAKLATMNNQLLAIANWLFEEITIEELQLKKSLGELNEMKSRLVNSEQQYTTTFHSLLRYVDEHKERQGLL